MKKTLRLLRQGFQTSSGMTPEFKAFAKTFKSELKQELESNRATNIVFSVGHFYLSGFYTVENQAWFFCISDVRFSPEEGVMYRRANNYKDYTGGTNRYVKIETGMGNQMIKRNLR